jgi:hypothetical protein
LTESGSLDPEVVAAGGGVADVEVVDVVAGEQAADRGFDVFSGDALLGSILRARSVPRDRSDRPGTLTPPRTSSSAGSRFWF